MSQRSGTERTFSSMVAFVQARTWDGSRRILLNHPELMTVTGQSTLRSMITDRETTGWIFPGVDPERTDILIRLHYVLLGRCRQVGIRGAFTELVAQIGPLASGAEGKAFLPLSSFLTAADQDAALAVLQEYPELAGVATASLVNQLIGSARIRREHAIRRRLVERRRLLDQLRAAAAQRVEEQRDDLRVATVLALVGLLVVASAAAVLLMRSGGPNGSGSDSPHPVSTAGMTKRTAAPETKASATGETQKVAATTPVSSRTPEVLDAHASPNETASRPATAEPTTQALDTASPTGPPGPSPFGLWLMSDADWSKMEQSGDRGPFTPGAYRFG